VSFYSSTHLMRDALSLKANRNDFRVEIVDLLLLAISIPSF
jgi:hypothetical protein